MSRSYKKHKVITCGKDAFLKRYANRKLRKNKKVANFSNYKRHFESWDICDYKFYVTDKQFIQEQEKGESVWTNPKYFRK